MTRRDCVKRVKAEHLERRALLSAQPPTAVECLPWELEEDAAAELVEAAPPFPTNQTFLLHSRPTATKVIYLDFDGHTTSGTSWNTTYENGNDFYTPAFSSEGDTNTFTVNELERIQRIWQRVVEDFAPFDVDVTTEEPPLEDLRKVGAGDTRWGVRVVIGGDGAWYGSAGGVAYVGSFDWNSDTPCFVFEDRLSSGEKNITEATSHEAGHTLGLSHDGKTPSTEYYSGHGSGATGWAPIMGVGYSRQLTQWSKGEYAGANQTQNDLSIITTSNGFGYRPDDYGNTAATGSLLGSTLVSGVIETTSDVDVFTIPTGGGTLVLNIEPFYLGPNLDILAELRNSSGTLIASSNPADSLNASFSLSLSPGTYSLFVSGVGKGDPLTTGYSDYGSLGQYTITTPTPGNDNFANRIALSGPSVGGSGTNVGSTKETGEPAHAGNAGGKSIWWSWTAPATAPFTISTAGSSFDTLLGIYTGSTVSSLAPIASNDNAPGLLTSLVTLNAIAGATYQIAVDGRDGASGTVSLAIYQPVTTPTYLTPADGVLLTSRPVVFDWEDVPAATSYDLYLNNVLTAPDLTESTWTGLATGASQNFTWRVVAQNEFSSATGATWSFTLDTTAPTASLQSTPPTTGAATLDFNVTYTDSLTGIDVGTIDDNDVYVTGPNGFNAPATLVSVNNPANGSPRVATYRIAAPGGFWSDADHGTYVVMQSAAQVRDGAGNARPGSPIGAISVSNLSFAWTDSAVLNLAFDGSATPLQLTASGDDLLVTKNSTTRTFAGVISVRARATGGDDRLILSGVVSPTLSFDDSGGNDLLELASGAHTFDSDIGTPSTSLGIAVASGASATFNASQHLRSLLVDGAAALASDENLSLVVDDLLVTGRLDLKDNELVWRSSNPATLDALTALVVSGRNDGDWQGNGVVTSMPYAIYPNHLMTLGVSQSQESVIARYTYAGDADLDRTINGDDYFYIDSNILAQVPGYHNGDFDYNGVIDGDDYFLIDGNYLQAQSPTLPAAAPAASAGAQRSSLTITASDVESAYKRLLDADGDFSPAA